MMSMVGAKDLSVTVLSHSLILRVLDQDFISISCLRHIGTTLLKVA